MAILKIGFSGLRYLIGKSAKAVNKVLPKTQPRATEVLGNKKLDFNEIRWMYDPESPEYIHRIF